VASIVQFNYFGEATGSLETSIYNSSTLHSIPLNVVVWTCPFVTESLFPRRSLRVRSRTTRTDRRGLKYTIIRVRKKDLHIVV
jgi:hypothetical protein